MAEIIKIKDVRYMDDRIIFNLYLKKKCTIKILKNIILHMVIILEEGENI